MRFELTRASFLKWFRKNWFWVAVILILIFASVLRFYNFTTRFAFNEDQARDVLIVQEILKTGNFPLIGPPSSAGPFSYGPWYYWILSFVSFLFPFFLTPWIFVTVISALFVFILILIGRLIGGNSAGIIAGLLAAVSTAEIRISTHLADVSFVSIFAALAVLAAVLFLKSGKSIFVFFIGLATALAINMHFSVLALLPLLIAGLAIKKSLIKNIFLLLAGFSLPFIPLFIFNFTHNWIILRNLLDFFLHGQEKFWVSIRWLTYMRDFWPETWASIIGGSKFFSYLIFALLAIFIGKDLYGRKLNKIIIIFLFIWFLQIIMLRYWRGERQAVWLLYFNPIILFLTTWVISRVFTVNKIIAGLLISVFAVATFVQDISHLTYVNQFAGISELKKQLITTYPDSAFQIYNCEHSYARNGSLPLTLLLSNARKIDHLGIPLGVYLSQPNVETVQFSYDIKASGAYVVVEFEPERIPKNCSLITGPSVYKETVLSYSQ